MDAEAILQSQNAASRQQIDEIVVDFGVDRIIKLISQAGTLAVFGCVCFLTFGSSMISCYPIMADNNKDIRVSTAAKLHIETYCWETDASDLNTETMIGTTPFHQSKFDPRFLMDFFPLLLLIQLVILPIPSYFWNATCSGAIFGHVKYIQLLIEQLANEAAKVKTVLISANLPDQEKLDVYDEEGSAIKPTIYSSAKKKGEDFPAGVTDMKMLNLLFYQNIAHLHHYPYLRAMFKLNQTNATGKSVEVPNPNGGDPLLVTNPELNEAYSGVKIPQMKAILGMWTSKFNLQSRYLVRLYILKQICTMLLCGFMIFLMTGGDQGFPPFEIETMFKCDMTETLNLVNSCVLIGYEEVVYLWYVNLVVIILLAVLALIAIISLVFFRSNHEAANFIGFLGNSNTVFEQIQSQEEKLVGKDGDEDDDESVAESSEFDY